MVESSRDNCPDERRAPVAAVVFPGQGSQSPEMAAVYDSHPSVAAAIDEASAAINADLRAVMRDKALLNDTANTQPALLAVCVGVFRAANLPPPAAMAGHSLGEYAALVCGGAIAFADAARLVRRRGELMRDAAEGGMAAIIGDPAAAEKLCESARASGARIWAANYNSPRQTVVSGDAASVAACRGWTSAPGVKRVLPLPVGAPSHCPLMRPAAEKFIADLRAADWRMPSPPVLHNATLRHAESPSDIADALAAQLVRPVRWTETIARFAADGVSQICECGPGGVLCGLARAMAGAPPHISLANGADIDAARRGFAAN